MEPARKLPFQPVLLPEFHKRTPITRQNSPKHIDMISPFVGPCVFLTLYLCAKAIAKLPPGEKSFRKSLLLWAMSLLTSGVLIATFCRIASFCGPLTAALLYAMAIAGSVLNFYVYIIWIGGRNC